MQKEIQDNKTSQAKEKKNDDFLRKKNIEKVAADINELKEAIKELNRQQGQP